MDIFLRLLVRMAYWVRSPPSRQFIIAAAIAVVAALTIAAIEHFIGWPDVLTVESLPRRPLPR